MRHAILGAGAIGGLVGTVLASLGEDVAMIVRPQTLAGYPADLHLERPSGNLTARATALSSLSLPTDVLWIATKTYQLETALDAVKTPPNHVVPLLNGVDHIASLRTRFGAEPVIPATIAVEAEKVAPARFLQRSPVVRLNLATMAEPILGAIIAKLGGLAFKCQFIANEQTLLWSKLCFLGPFALATSASGLDLGQILADAHWKQTLDALVGEASAVANASGAQIDAAQIRAVFSSSPPGMRSSMQKDLAAGRQLELDAIGGPIVRGGERFRIDVPATIEVMSAIRAKTSARPTG